MKYYIVSEEELRRLSAAVDHYAQLTGSEDSQNFWPVVVEREADCRARPVPDDAKYVAFQDKTGLLLEEEYKL
jgi:hypothetical protein